MSEREVYRVYRDGELVAEGTAEACAEACGIDPWTVECGECGANAGLWQSEAVAAASWNHRAALSEADFAAAVHDGSLWRKERTCRMDGPDPVYWRCTSCGAFVRRDAVADCHRVISATWCPNCRARIERGDEA